MIVHPIIKEKLTPIVPKILPLKKLIMAANIRSIEDIFPGINICVNGGFPLFLQSKLSFTACSNIQVACFSIMGILRCVISLK
jgi:hypothetical protein